MVSALPRGMRNNNPLNIEHSPANDWRGLADPPTDGRFCRFSTMELGVRAAAVLIRNYQTRYGLRTVRGIVSRWAPKVENNVSAYVASVVRHSGLEPDERLDLNDARVLVRLIRAMARHENGVELSELSAKAGVALAV